VFKSLWDIQHLIHLKYKENIRRAMNMLLRGVFKSLWDKHQKRHGHTAKRAVAYTSEEPWTYC
jgi:hypothetical protein